LVVVSRCSLLAGCCRRCLSPALSHRLGVLLLRLQPLQPLAQPPLAVLGRQLVLGLGTGLQVALRPRRSLQVALRPRRSPLGRAAPAALAPGRAAPAALASGRAAPSALAPGRAAPSALASRSRCARGARFRSRCVCVCSASADPMSVFCRAWILSSRCCSRSCRTNDDDDFIGMAANRLD